MTKQLLLLFILAFALHTCKAQQIYECKSLGFKFVMDCDCFDVLVKMGKNTTPYTMNIVPKITYILKNGPADGKGFVIGCRIFRINDESIFDKTGEEVIALLEKTNGGAVKLELGLGFAGGAVSQVLLYPKSGLEFPEPNYAPVEGGPKLIGTLGTKSETSDARSVMYENGDYWYGNVINKMYPDYSSPGGTYTSQEESMKKKYDEYAAIKQKVEDEKQKEANEKQQAAIKQEEQLAAAIIQNRQDSINNFKSRKELIEIIYPDVAKRPMLYGIGIDVKKERGVWIVSEVMPASSAWFFGVKEGDVLISVDGMQTTYMVKRNIIAATMGSPWAEKIIEIGRNAENINSQKVFTKCYTVYYRPASFTHGCLSGDCENGNGVYMDEKGVIYKGGFINGKFNNHHVSKNGGEMINAAEKMYTYCTFVNGIKNGYAIIYSDRGKIISLANAGGGYGSSGIITVGYGGEFKNDVPEGKGVLTRDYSDYYNVNYVNGVIKGQALKVVDPQHYRYCDVTARFEPVNCKDFTGTPPDVSMLPATSTSSSSIPAKQQQNTTGQKAYEHENTYSRLALACAQFKDWTGGNCTWTDGGSFVFSSVRSSSEDAYWQVPVPKHSTVYVQVMMANDEVEKVRFKYNNLIIYNIDYTNIITVTNGTIPEIGVYYKVFALENIYDVDLRFSLNVTGYESSNFYTRTVVWGYCTAGM